MSRSLKKGMYITPSLLKKVTALRESGKATSVVVKTWARDCTIFPDMVGMKFAIHNGKDFITVLITEDMVGHRLGEFALTRKFQGHAKKGKISKLYGFSGRFLKE
ncbi:MAG: 30S ribosomal protein S19 [Candidatus Dojkabacteria bacterium]|nr:MAG: 30S ribosomal protein S19 [Candidatus Dojkabacteria bacterium]